MRGIFQVVKDKNPPLSSDDDAIAHLEIERKYLLRGLPELPPGTIAVKIEQGYLSEGDLPAQGGDDLLQGRLRRMTMPDGSEIFIHTIKQGRGLVRQETERELTRAEFERQWPRTQARRLSKIRHRVPVGELIWEIDEFKRLGLVLAEVELPDVTAASPIPDWLVSHIVREVTDEPEFRNYELALRAMKE